MKRILITAPTATPVSLSEIKDNLDVNYDTRDDFLTSCLGAAVEKVESLTGRKLITQTWKLVLDSSIGDIGLPFGQLQSVTSVVYLDEDGAEQTVDAGDYYIDGADTDQGKIIFKDSFSFPTLYDYEPIRVTFVCGYGDAGSDVPESLKQAIHLSVSDMWDGEDSQLAINALLDTYRLWSGLV